MELAEAGIEDELVGDLYSIQQFLFESGLQPKRYFTSLTEGHFERPGFLIKYIDAKVIPVNMALKRVESEVMVQYFASSHFDGLAMLGKLLDLFSGYPSVLLPLYDFTTDPPSKISVSGVDANGVRVTERKMGLRIDPNTVKGEVIPAADETYWNVPITFTMTAVRLRANVTPDVMEQVEYENRVVAVTSPIEATLIVRGEPSVATP